MAKLTQKDIAKHQEACRLLEKDSLDIDDRITVVENWHEGATNLNSAFGAYFTPWQLAVSFAVESRPGKIIDLCAGIGTLSLAVMLHHPYHPCQFVCVESNPDYVAIGRKVMPEATWILGDAMDVLKMDLGHFDLCISNPPFGKSTKSAPAPRYTGAEFEFKVMDIASMLADNGLFIVPQNSAPFRMSGQKNFQRTEPSSLVKLYEQTGIVLEPNCGIDTSDCEFRGTKLLTEIVLADFKHPSSEYIPRSAHRNSATTIPNVATDNSSIAPQIFEPMQTNPVPRTNPERHAGKNQLSLF